MRILYLLIALSFVAGPVGEASAENPTREKCTCNLNPDDPPEDGAWVKNASACWSTEIREQNWCDVVVEGLQGPQSSSAELLGNADSPSGLVNILRSRFDNFIKVSEVEGSIVNLNQATEIVASRLKENDVLVADCVTAFVGGKRGFVQDGDGGVVCRVSESSGWLRLEIPVDGARIAYMVAPVP